ncbi:MAG: hypothetical protein NC226_09410 [Bacteroides cellulosilyticus]|nr:hypothetical protein [Bacteroides cellulosilyticus]
MAKNYGNSFGIKEYPSVGVKTINVWHRITSKIPVGAVLAVSDTYPAGSVVPVGTPVSTTEIGGAANVGAAADLTLPYSGLLEHDTVMGTQCCSLSVVDGGELLIDRINAEISDEQKEALKGRIKFYPQITD